MPCGIDNHADATCDGHAIDSGNVCVYLPSSRADTNCLWLHHPPTTTHNHIFLFFFSPPGRGPFSLSPPPPPHPCVLFFCGGRGRQKKNSFGHGRKANKHI